jgi:hypothetical protein
LRVFGFCPRHLNRWASSGNSAKDSRKDVEPFRKICLVGTVGKLADAKENLLFVTDIRHSAFQIWFRVRHLGLGSFYRCFYS